jgi:phosphatidylinositol alpha-mannosyltransferase
MKSRNEKLSIAFLFDDTLDSNDGVAQYVKALGAWMSGRGHRVSYLVGGTKMKDYHGANVHSLARNLPVHFNGNRLSIPLPAAGGPIRKALADSRPDVIHVQVPHSPLMAQRVLNRASPAVAVVGTFHIFPAGSLASRGSKILRLMYLRGLSRFDRMLSVSPPAARFAKQFFGLSSKVVPNVINLAVFQKAARNSSRTEASDILFLGRLVPRKGCLELLEAFALLRKRYPKVGLSIAGDGPERSRLQKFVEQNDLQEAVRFLGRIGEAEKPKILAGAKIACFPSLHGESFGIVLIEAMAAGSGVVLGGNNPGYRSVLDGQPELIVKPQDSVAFARKLELLLNNHALRRRLHNWQTEHVKQYDVAVVGPQIETVYRQAIAKRQRKVHN